MPALQARDVAAAAGAAALGEAPGLQAVALFGCPRSGTSWLGQILNSAGGVAYRYQPLFSYEFKDWFGRFGLDEASLRAFHAALLDARSDFVLQDLRPAKSGPATHLVWKEVRYHALMAPLLALPGLAQLVYLYRRPVDVLNSWFLAPKEFRAGQDIHAEWLHAPSKNLDASEFNGFAKWKESLALACRLQAACPGRVTLLSYEALRADPQAQVGALFERLRLPLDEPVRAFIASSTSRQEAGAYSVFRSQRTPLALPPAIVERIRADETARALLAQADACALKT